MSTTRTARPAIALSTDLRQAMMADHTAIAFGLLEPLVAPPLATAGNLGRVTIPRLLGASPWLVLLVVVQILAVVLLAARRRRPPAINPESRHA
jgi:hypothetical protein